ncbi:MAG: 30S ribosomal protein S8 [Candidatus Pacearchaeota archaeon]|jgi:ribosomal protein S8
MSQDIIADTLNEIMNAKRSRKNSVIVDRHSKLLLNVLEMAKKYGYIEDFDTDKTKLKITIGKLNECKVIKPRFNISNSEIEKYRRRFLPARDMGIMIISTSKGLMDYEEAMEKNLGGALIAYFY